MNPINGQTNVTSLRTGHNCVQDIGRELGKFVVTTMEEKWLEHMVNHARPEPETQQRAIQCEPHHH